MEKPEGLSMYARLYDETNPEWHNNAEMNRTILSVKEQWANHKLVMDGFVFLNDIYEQLGFERSSAGQLVGWLKDSETGDNYIDFGLYEKRNEAFINGQEPSVWLDFNVDGVMFDKIPTQRSPMGDEETTTTTTEVTETKAPEPSTSAQEVVEEVHEKVEETAPVERTTTVTETVESD